MIMNKHSRPQAGFILSLACALMDAIMYHKEPSYVWIVLFVLMIVFALSYLVELWSNKVNNDQN